MALRIRGHPPPRQPPLPMGGRWHMDSRSRQRGPHVQRYGRMEPAVRIVLPPQLQASEKDGELFFQTDGGPRCDTVDNMLVHHGSHEDAITLPVLLSELDTAVTVRAWAAHGGIAQDLLIPTEGNTPLMTRNAHTFRLAQRDHVLPHG